MKIALINPPYTLEERYGSKLKYFGGNAEPLALAYLASSVRADGHKVEIIDAVVENFTPQLIAQKLKNDSFDIAGITMLTPAYDKVKATAGAIRQYSPGTRIIIGGAHASALPFETLTDIKCDFVVKGEAEITLRELANTLELGNDPKTVNGIFFKDSKTLYAAPPREFERNLDNIPMPARDLLPMSKYFLTATRLKKSGYCGTVIVARGCPFSCSYCSHPLGRTFRHHSPERIISEINLLVSRYNATQINLEADTLTIDKNFVIALCAALKDSGLNKKVRWTCESRADTLDEEILAAMKQAGCWQISLGVESGVDRLLNRIQKKETTALIMEKAKLIKKAGISIRAFYMLGLPSEDASDSLQTIDFAKKLDSDWAQFTITIPYPGTPLFEELKNEGKIRSFSWSDYKTQGGWTQGTLPFVEKGRTQEELKRLQRYAIRSFYMRLRVIFRFIKSINSFASLKRCVLGFLLLVFTKAGVAPKRGKTFMQGLMDFLFFPVRALFPNNELAFQSYLGLTALSKERYAIVVDRLRGLALDIGCGDNSVIKMYRLENQEGYGLDKILASEADIIADASKELPLKKSSFDSISFVGSLNHITDRAVALQEAKRLLKDEGIVLITMLSPFIGWFGHRVLWRFWGDPDQHTTGRNIEDKEVWGISKKMMRKLAEDAGFTLESHKKFVYGLNSLFVLKK
ncbi:MAG: radical SAM protein [Candidatus Omnitrophota bacterium]